MSEPTPTQRLMRDTLARIEHARGKLNRDVARSTIRDYAERRAQEGAIIPKIAGELIDYGFPVSDVYIVLGDTASSPTITSGPSVAETAVAQALATERGGTPEEYATEASLMDRIMAPGRYAESIIYGGNGK